MTKILYEKLSNDYIELFNHNDESNVIIKVVESSNIKEFQAHSVMLKYRSLYFRDKLTNAKEDENNMKIINLKNISIQQFEFIIKYIYGGLITLESHDVSFLFDLMFIAHEFLLEELVKLLETYLIEERAHWLRLHFNKIYQKSFQNSQFQKLQEWCTDIVVKYPNMVFNLEDFGLLQENMLVSLIKRDDLQIEEGKIWNYVIKWGIAQNPGLPLDSDDWTRENFEALKTTLQNCLPHIRYFQISGNDIIDNVQPYQKIIENNLWKDIMKRIVNPNQPISSTILPPRVILTQNLPLRVTVPFSEVINEEQNEEQFVEQNSSLKKELAIAERKMLARNERIQALEDLLLDAQNKITTQNLKFKNEEQLVEENSSLKIEVAIAERKILARNERIQALEALLEDAQEHLTTQNQKFEAQLQAVRERLEQARAQRKTASATFAGLPFGRIAKPLRRGGDLPVVEANGSDITVNAQGRKLK